MLSLCLGHNKHDLCITIWAVRSIEESLQRDADQRTIFTQRCPHVIQQRAPSGTGQDILLSKSNKIVPQSAWWGSWISFQFWRQDSDFHCFPRTQTSLGAQHRPCGIPSSVLQQSWRGCGCFPPASEIASSYLTTELAMNLIVIRAMIISLHHPLPVLHQREHVKMIAVEFTMDSDPEIYVLCQFWKK